MPETPPPSDSVPDAGDVTVVRPAQTRPEASGPAAPLFAGRYALLRLLGRGGMGSVHQARDTLVGDVVALKMLDLGPEAGADALERFSREVRLARRITHPHVARMHDLGTHAGQAFLTMEYVEGEDLRQLLARRGAVGAAQAARIALAVCEGLAAAHLAGVVHRDLKPANILLETGGRVVLTDFGIARAVAEERASRTQGAIGTPLYMAPEQVAGEPVDARADLYAVGLLLYELLTGQLPFSSETPWGAAIARLTRPPPDLRQVPGVPAPLAQLVHRCLSRAPAERPASAGEVASVLREWLSQAGEALPVSPPVTSPGPDRTASTSTPRSMPSLVGATSVPVPRSLALLPLRFQGPRDSEYLGDSVTESLGDQFSRTRGFHVLGSGVTARFRDKRDPRTLGSELGVDWMVDGTLQCAGSAVRVAVRLLETRSGGQLWSGRFEHPSLDVFELQDRLVPRIAEELRFEGLLAAWRTRATPDSLALYRQAFQQLHREVRSASEGPRAQLAACLQQSPDFTPALALHALASVRAWFSSRSDNTEELAREARESVERALSRAADLPETHLARAMMAAQESDWRSAVIHARMALDIAPFHVLSLLYLGGIQCEAGRADEGLERLQLAHALMPGMESVGMELARAYALRGRMDEYREAMSRLTSSLSHRVVVGLLGVRVAAWTRDLEEVRRVRQGAVMNTDTVTRLTALYAAAVLGEISLEELLPQLEDLLSQRVSPRFVSMMCQFITEILCLSGEVPRALAYFQRAASTALIDMVWMENCPAIQPLRSLPGFAEGQAQVRARVQAIWNT